MTRTLSRPVRWLSLLVLPLVALLLITACGDDDADVEPDQPAVREALGQTNPSNAPGQTLYLERVTVSPQSELPTHYHEGTQVAYIQSGVLTYVIVSGTAEVVRANGTEETFGGPITIQLHEGDHIVETQDLIHHGANETDDPVVILLAVLLREGAPLSTPVEN